MKRYYVYRHTFPNGKVYIGITFQNPIKRWANGFGYRNQKLVYRAIEKYGWENIKHEILYENLTIEEAENKEIELIAFYKSNQKEFGYNILEGGDISRSTYIMSDEVKKKVSSSLKGFYSNHLHHMNGKKLPQKTRNKISEGNKGKHAKEKHHFYGKHLSDIHKQRLSKANEKPIYQYDLDGNMIRRFDGIKEAAKILNLKDASHISDCCKRKRKTAYGYKWEYVAI